MLAAVKILIASFPQVLLVTSADDLECTPGFQRKVLHIHQPAEFIEDQPVLNCKLLQKYLGPAHADSSAVCNVSQDVGHPRVFRSCSLCRCLALGGCCRMTDLPV